MDTKAVIAAMHGLVGYLTENCCRGSRAANCAARILGAAVRAPG